LANSVSKERISGTLPGFAIDIILAMHSEVPYLLEIMSKSKVIVFEKGTKMKLVKSY
jgi:hypothetical protein